VRNDIIIIILYGQDVDKLGIRIICSRRGNDYVTYRYRTYDFESKEQTSVFRGYSTRGLGFSGKDNLYTQLCTISH